MSIQKQHDYYIPVCDLCGEVVEGDTNFCKALQLKKEAEWKSFKNKHGEWEYCYPYCQELTK